MWESLRRGHGELSDHILFMLHFNLQVFMGEDIRGAIENSRQLPGKEPMFEVIMNPSLEEARFLKASGSAAIDEPLCNVPHLGDVVMGGNLGTIGKADCNRLFWVGSQLDFEFFNVHGLAAVYLLNPSGRGRLTNLVYAGEEVPEASARELVADIEPVFF